MIAQLISPHHLSTPSHLVYTCKEHFVSDTLSQVPLSYKLKLPLPVIHLPFVRARQAHLILKNFFCMALSSSLVFFPTKRTVWDGVCANITVDHITAAFWSLWVGGYLVVFGTGHIFRWSLHLIHGMITWDCSCYTGPLLRSVYTQKERV